MINYESYINKSTDDLYTEEYKTLYPYVQTMIAEMENQYGNIYVNEELLSSMEKEILSRSGINAQYENADYNGADYNGAIPAMSYNDGYNSRYRNYNRNNGYGYDRNHSGSNGLLRVLLLREIFGRGARPRWRY